MTSQPNQLILTAGSLGDSLLTLPGLRALQNLGPVTVAGTHPYSDLGAELFGVKEIIPGDPLLQTLLKDETPPNGTIDFLKSFDRIFLFFKEKDQPLIQKITNLCGQVPLVNLRPFSDFLQTSRWAGEYWLETALQTPVNPESPLLQSKLMIQDQHREKGKRLLKDLGMASPLIIHPGSGSPAKNAPLSFFQKAALRAVQESGKQVLVLWGEAERERLGEITDGFKNIPGVQVMEAPLPLRDLACLMSQASAFLGNDSGVTHLASACGVRTFAVFYATDNRIWGPQANFIILNMLKGILH